jgi:hypothetical protein
MDIEKDKGGKRKPRFGNACEKARSGRVVRFDVLSRSGKEMVSMLP